MKTYTLFMISSAIALTLHAQTFQTSFQTIGVDDVVSDVQYVSDSVYIGVILHAIFPIANADSIEVFRLNGEGNLDKSIIIKEAGYTYSRIWRSVVVPNDPQGRVIIFSSKYNTDGARAYVFCVDQQLNVLWEYSDIQGGEVRNEAFSQGLWEQNHATLYGHWFDDPFQGGNAHPFFLHLDANGIQIALQPIPSMNNRDKGNDRFVRTENALFFFRANQTYYKCNKDTYQIIDSFEVELDTAFLRGFSRPLANGNIAVLGFSDSIISFNPPIYTSVPTVVLFDSSGHYLSRFRKIVHIAEEGKPYIEGIDIMPNGDIVVTGFEGFSGGEPKSDWFSLQRFTQTGELVWERYYRLGKRFNARSTRACPDGGILVSGYTYLNGERNGQIYKFDSLGNLSSIVPVESPVDSTFPLMVAKVYPNPTSDVLHIETNFPMTYDIELIKHDGRMVYRAKIHEPYHSINLAQLTQGVYFMVLRNSQGNVFQKLSVHVTDGE